MFKRLPLLFVCVLAGLLLSAVGAAPKGGSSSLMFSVWAKSIHNPVEQESPNFFFPPCLGVPTNEGCNPSTWVTNPTGRVWDVDDWWDDLAKDGWIGPGESVSDTIGMVADGFDNYSGDDKNVQARITAFTPDLNITLSSNQGLSWTLTPVLRTRSQGSDYWEYSVCTIDRTRGPYPEIPDTNGGTGILVNYTLTVTNPTNKRAQSVTALLEVFGIRSGTAAPVCR